MLKLRLFSRRSTPFPPPCPALAAPPPRTPRAHGLTVWLWWAHADDRVSLSVGRAIQQGRMAKGLTQKDLATKINEKPTVINEFESSRALPNPQILGKMERVLGVKLRGKDIGSPLAPPGGAK